MSNFDKKAGDVQNKANDIYQDGKEHAKEFYNDNRDKVETMVDSVKDVAEKFYDEGIKHYHTAEKAIDDSADNLIKIIKSNPLASVMVAGTVGWLLSALTKK